MPGWCNETIEATAFEDIGGHMENLALGIGLGAWLVYGIAVCGHLFITLRFRVKISISLLKRCSLHDIKDTVKNAWTNIGLTTSLVMTTVIGALIEGHEITPQGFCTDHLTLLHIKQVYVALCMACLFANVNCIIYCVLSLFYWDSLSQADAVAFLRENPQVLGETVIYMVESYILFIAAIATWIYGTYGQTFITGIFPCFALSAIINLTLVWTNLHFFHPKDRQADQIGPSGCCSRRRSSCADTERWTRVLDAISEHEPTHSDQSADPAESMPASGSSREQPRRNDEALAALATNDQGFSSEIRVETQAPTQRDRWDTNDETPNQSFTSKEWHVWRFCRRRMTRLTAQSAGCCWLLFRRRWLSHIVNTMEHRKREVSFAFAQMLLCIPDRTHHPCWNLHPAIC